MENENSFLSVLLTVSVFVISIGCRNGGKDNSTAPIDTNQTFGIYMSQLDGGKFSPIILDHTREMNHARVSPDKTKITFTRFNRDSNNNGLSEENDGYYKTEVMIANLDGSELESLIPPSEDHINCNSYWTPDGSGMIYMSNDNESLLDILSIKHIDISTREITNLVAELSQLPWVSDPHMMGNELVFPGGKNAEVRKAIWLKNLDNDLLTQMTFPETILDIPLPFGDSDPKISPDGTKMAFTRQFEGDVFHNVLLDRTTNIETNLSPAEVKTDVMPEWSSDGELLIFWHVDMLVHSNIGLYTVKPDGTERKKVPLQFGYHWTMPAFFPGEGSSPQSRIIFSGKINKDIR